MPPIQKSIMDFLKPKTYTQSQEITIKKEEKQIPKTPVLKPINPKASVGILKTPSPKPIHIAPAYSPSNQSPQNSIDVSRFYSPSPIAQDADPILFKPTKETPMLKQYNYIRNQLEIDTALFLQNGAFYELYEQDASFGGQFLQLKVVQKHENMVMSGVPMVQGDFFIKRSLQLNRRICVALQFEQQDPRFKIQKREISYLLSPGLIQDPDFLSSSAYGLLFLDTNSAIFIDLIKQSFSHFEIPEDEDLQQLLILIQPAEVLTSDIQKAQIAKIYVSCVTYYPESYFEKLVNEGKFSHFPKILNQYLSYMRVGKLNQMEFQQDDITKNVFLPSSTIYSLNLECKTGYSLLKTINFTQTKQGFQMLRKQVLRPFFMKEDICQYQKLIQSFASVSLEQLKQIQKQLKQCIDYEKYTHYIIKQAENVKFPINQFQVLIVSFQKGINVLNQLLTEQFYTVFIDRVNVASIQQIVDQFNQNFQIINKELHLHDSNSNFQQQKQKSDEFQNTLLSYLRELKLSYVTQPILAKSLSSKDSRNFLGFTPAPNQFLVVGRDLLSTDQLLSAFKGKHSLTYIASTQTVHKFAFPEIFQKEVENQIQSQNCMLKTSISEFLSYLKIDQIAQFSAQIALFDFAISLAILPLKHANFPWCFPQIQTASASKLSFRNAVHPIAFSTQTAWQKQSFSASKPAILTGANTSGKSTVLRLIGTLAILAQIGAPVPAEEAVLVPFSAVLARVGGSKSANSTFAAECLETSFLTNSMTGRSLVLIDEIGRGTESSEGDALGQGVCVEIQKMGVCGIVATHSAPVKALAAVLGISLINMTSFVQNSSVVNKYEIDESGEGKSYGIEVARGMGIQESVIEEAEKLRDQMEKQRKIKLFLKLQELCV
ncbi:Mismatch repair protein [Spironucleus salmonicida]|uniref:Mismatch repair protein n=1 Tax=Spironucleus salmonicida TaxID=348837 RepID=V6M382_9EUKA|nr:Mismatch repair protein [Spironucleus salmonicida]|eukprot:EST47729.1 Mismatch repair protein [Spironucleus salmonicida]